MRTLFFTVLRIFLVFLSVGSIGFFVLNQLEPELAYMPASDEVLNPEIKQSESYYVLWGKRYSEQSARQHKLTPAKGAIHVTPDLLRLGKKVFYQETFGNELFLTDILGLVDGPITVTNLLKSIIALKGKGTTNLQVPLAKTVTIAGKTYRKGTKIATGIDVPKGSYLPMGMPIKFSEGRLKVGVSCAACHARVDPKTMKVVQGAYNHDLNHGLLLAMATNSSAFFTHAKMSEKQLNALTDHLKRLPDKKKMEEMVDRTFAKWPVGMFDSTIDLEANLTKIPDSFTANAHPYGWSGFASVGPFKGLSAFCNNVHAQNSDSLSQVTLSKPFYGLSRDLYLGIILQNAANPKYRYQPRRGETASQFFAKVDPTPDHVGINENIPPPTYPKITPMALDGTFISSKGYKAGEQIYAVAAWQNTLLPPEAPVKLDPQKIARGRKVFVKANCIKCHAGSALTKNRVLPVEVVGTNPSRAQALKKTSTMFARPRMYTPDTPVPLPKNAKSIPIPVPDPEQIKLGYAHGHTKGGYKIPSLKGLYWRAPYLHDAGVAVGPNPNRDLGVTGTLLKQIQADPINSLRALLDRRLRQLVIKANHQSSTLRKLNIEGVGHPFWVDQDAGFRPEEQEALLQYLLSH